MYNIHSTYTGTHTHARARAHTHTHTHTYSHTLSHTGMGGIDHHIRRTAHCSAHTQQAADTNIDQPNPAAYTHAHTVQPLEAVEEMCSQRQPMGEKLDSCGMFTDKPRVCVCVCLTEGGVVWCVSLCINVCMHACMYTETALQQAWVGMIVMMPEAPRSVRQGRRPLMPTSAVCMDVCNKRKQGNSGRELCLCAFI